MNDLTGKIFGRLTVIQLEPVESGKGRFWKCACSCGKITVKATSKLNDASYADKSCGCAQIESCRRASLIAANKRTKFIHPLKKKLKDMRQNMLKRCYNPTANRYECYGGRGITVCELWRENPTAFYEWAVANGAAENLSIERISHSGNYESGNVRFAGAVEQANNTRRNHFIEHDGKRLTVAQWAAKLGIKPQVIWHRMARGWSIEEMLSTPLRTR